jgi:hypothetical protein
MVLIERPGQSPIVLNAPTDPALASLWDLAQLEFQARDGQDPVTQADWAVVTARYHALVTERRAELGAVIREVRTGVEIKSVRTPVPLRQWLTPFGHQIAAVLEPRSPVIAIRWSVLSASEAVPVMRQVLQRHGLERQHVLQQGTGPSWYEAPDVWLRAWTSTESVIVLKADDAGPVELRILTRIDTETVKAVMRIGRGTIAFGLRRALWDVGIRRIVGELPTSTPAGFIQEIRDLGVALRDRGDGWFEYTDVITRRPDAEKHRAALALRPHLRPEDYAAEIARVREEERPR